MISAVPVCLEPSFTMFDPAVVSPSQQGLHVVQQPYDWALRRSLLPRLGKLDWRAAAAVIAGTASIPGPLSLECYVWHDRACFYLGAPAAQIDMAAGVWQAAYPESALVAAPDPWEELPPTIPVLADWYSPAPYHRCLRSAGSWWPHIFGLSSVLGTGDAVFVQVLWSPVRHAWHRNVPLLLEAERSLGQRAPDGWTVVAKPLDEPLFAACVRLGTTIDGLASRLAALAGLFTVDGVPLRSRSLEEFLAVVPLRAVRAMLCDRTTLTAGQVLASSEEALFAHVPDESAAGLVPLPFLAGLPVAERLRREGDFLGVNTHRGVPIDVFEPPTQNRNRWAVGRSRSGKSTAIVQKVVQLALQGCGVGLIDPHRETAFRLLDTLGGVAPERVVFLDFDADLPVAFNPFAYADADDYGRLTTEYLQSFEHLLDQAGYHRTLHILGNLLYGLLVVGRNLATLPVLCAKSSEGAFLRGRIVREAKNAAVRYFWEDEYPRFGHDAFASVINRLSALLLDDRTYRTFAQDQNRVDVARIMDEGKLLIVAPPASIPAARIVVGVLIAQAKQAAFRRFGTSRAAQHFHLVVDEVHRFPSSANALQSIIDECAKGGLSVTLANQETSQFPTDFLKVLYSVPNIFVFGVNLPDARQLAQLFDGRVTPETLASQPTGHVYARLGNDIVDFQSPPPLASAGTAARLIAYSRQHYYATSPPIQVPSHRPRIIDNLTEEL